MYHRHRRQAGSGWGGPGMGGRPAMGTLGNGQRQPNGMSGTGQMGGQGGIGMGLNGRANMQGGSGLVIEMGRNGPGPMAAQGGMGMSNARGMNAMNGRGPMGGQGGIGMHEVRPGPGMNIQGMGINRPNVGSYAPWYGYGGWNRNQIRPVNQCSRVTGTNGGANGGANGGPNSNFPNSRQFGGPYSGGQNMFNSYAMGQQNFGGRRLGYGQAMMNTNVHTYYTLNGQTYVAGGYRGNGHVLTSLPNGTFVDGAGNIYYIAASDDLNASTEGSYSDTKTTTHSSWFS